MSALTQKKGSLPHGVARVARRTATQLGAWLARLGRPPRGGQGPRLFSDGGVLIFGLVPALVTLALVLLLIDPLAVPGQRGLPNAIVAAFEAITDVGKSGWVLVPAGLALLAIAAAVTPAIGRIAYGVAMSLVVRIGFVFLAVAIPGLVVTIVKRLIGRARPMHFDDLGAYGFDPLGWRVDYASFPSGHGTTAFGIAAAFGALFPRLRPLLWSLAALIALSRVVVAAHYPSDVVAGAICGVIGALLVRNWFAARRLGFVVTAAGTVRPMAGPSWARLKTVCRHVLRGA